MRQSFFFRLYTGYVLMILLTVVSISVLIHQATTHDSLREIEHSLEQQASLLRELALDALHGHTTNELNSQVTRIGSVTGTRLTVIGLDGTVLADSAEVASQMDNHSLRPEITQALASGTGTATRYSRTLEQEMMYLALRVDEQDQAIGYVRTSLPLKTVKHRLDVLRNNVLLGMAVALVLSLPLGYIVTLRISKPLASMTATAQAIAAGIAHSSINISSKDEIGRLARALNEMSVRLSERMETIARDRNQLEAMLGSMVEGLIAVDLQARIVHLNSAATALCAVDPADVLGMHTWDALRIPELDQALQQSLATDRTIERELAVISSRKTYALTVAPWRDSTASVVGAVIVLHDISKLRAIEKMRQDFIANASHELKSPLTAIQGFTETILSDEQMETDVREQFCRNILQDCRRLTRLVQDMLALSRAESGAQSEAFIVFDLHEAAQEAISHYDHNAVTAGLSLSYHPLAHPVKIKGSQHALTTAIGNLLDNATIHSEPGGRIDVHVSTDETLALIIVRDTGEGIPDEHHSRIFERFYRVDKARSRDRGGTGLGLAIVKHTAQSHGGSVLVQSVPGEGSTFTITIPLHLENN